MCPASLEAGPASSEAGHQAHKSILKID